jgi:hypothetical protein
MITVGIAPITMVAFHRTVALTTTSAMSGVVIMKLKQISVPQHHLLGVPIMAEKEILMTTGTDMLREIETGITGCHRATANRTRRQFRKTVNTKVVTIRMKSLTIGREKIETKTARHLISILLFCYFIHLLPISGRNWLELKVLQIPNTVLHTSYTYLV